MKTSTIIRLGKAITVLSMVMILTGVLRALTLNPSVFYSNIYAFFVLIIGLLYFPLTFLLISRSPHNVLSWLFLLVIFSLSVQTFGFALEQFEDSIPIFRFYNQLAGNMWVPAFMTPISLMLLFFPDGQLLSRRWRPILVAAVLGILLSYLGINFPDLANKEWANYLSILTSIILLISILGALLSVVLRFRKSKGVVRAQMKWLVYVAVLSIFLLLLFLGAGWQETPIFEVVFFSPPVLVALAIGMAILRYRLYDIDIIIRRTLIYAALTGTLAVVYFMIVVLLQRFLPAQTQLTTVLSTLTIAALFSPLRRRIQNDIDRLFFRRRYDAEKTLAAFAASVRDEVDLEELNVALMVVIEDTMQPDHVSLWLRQEQPKV